MTITRSEFQKYENVRISGRTNMFIISNVQKLSGLPKKKIILIMNNYDKLNKKYPDVKKH